MNKISPKVKTDHNQKNNKQKLRALRPVSKQASASTRVESIPSQVIDTAFKWARDRIRSITGFRSKKTSRARVNRSRKYTSVSQARKYTGIKGYRIETHYIEAQDGITFLYDSGIEGPTWDSVSNKSQAFTRNFGWVRQHGEFNMLSAVTSGWMKYRVKSLTLQFIPVASHATASSIGAGDSTITTPLLMPRIKCQLYNTNNLQLGEYIFSNTSTLILDPSKPQTRKVTIKFDRSSILFAGSLLGWAAMNQDYFTNNLVPKMKLIAEATDDDLSALLDGMQMYRVIYCYEIQGLVRDVAPNPALAKEIDPEMRETIDEVGECEENEEEEKEDNRMLNATITLQPESDRKDVNPELSSRMQRSKSEAKFNPLKNHIKRFGFM